MSPTHTWRGDCWPSPQQNLLLKAALLPGEEGLEAWRAWNQQIDLDTLDSQSARLLPLLYRNLASQKVEDPEIKRLGGIYRSTWYKNQLFLKRLQEILDAIEGAGIQAMLIKGMALAASVYPDLGYRPMRDVDILVAPEDTAQVFAILTERGWEAEDEPNLTAHLKFNHSLGWHSHHTHDLDIHWFAHSNRLDRESNRMIWQNSVLIKHGDYDLRIPSRTDNLLLVVDHGLKWEAPQAPLNWIADAYFLLAGDEEDLDWEALVASAQRRQLSYTLHHALTYLAQVLDLGLPARAWKALNGSTASSVERLEFRLKTHRGRFLGMAPLFLLRYFAFFGRRSPGPRLAEFPQFINYVLKLQSWGQLPLEIIRRLLNNFRATLS